MNALLLTAFAATVLATSFVSGIFGMAGGMLLMGALLVMVSVPDAMVLHGVAQMSSTGWRAALWRRYIIWSIVGRYLAGLVAAGLVFSALRLTPDARVVFIILGLAPLVGRMIPARLLPQATGRGGAEICGFVCTSLQLLSGVSGPMLDMFFVTSELDRRVVVATKAACQVITHLAKLVYFGLIIGGATGASTSWLVIALAVGLAILGTTASRSILERLTDQNFRRYTWWIVMTLGVVYLARGLYGYL